jgi:hypothetical protein
MAFSFSGYSIVKNSFGVTPIICLWDWGQYGITTRYRRIGTGTGFPGRSGSARFEVNFPFHFSLLLYFL